MKKIRINELARELEVKAHEILERLPEVGVSEKKTHSSSIDEDAAIRLRRLYGQEIPEDKDRKGAAEAPNGRQGRARRRSSRRERFPLKEPMAPPARATPLNTRWARGGPAEVRGETPAPE